MATLGQQLKQFREEKGVSLHVHCTTHQSRLFLSARHSADFYANPMDAWRIRELLDQTDLTTQAVA